jgi:N-carbamoylputrescine amidase
MPADILSIALITEVFHDEGGDERLRALLAEARSFGAELAVLPELPLDSWFPCSRAASDADAEAPEGPRHRRFAAAARAAGVALLSGAVVRDPSTGRRHNTALLLDGGGRLLGTHRKAHVPQEEGYWEADHYEPGDELPEVLLGLDMPLGVQLCSDVNRPAGTHILAALGAEAILCPRCTPTGSYPRWRLVLQAAAVTSAAYVISVNRPRPEGGVPIGGPSIAVAPDGAVLVETTDPLAIVSLDRSVVQRARLDYPGYLPVRADLYAAGWRRAAERHR